VDAAPATIVMPTVSLSWTMSAASAAKPAATTAATKTAAAAGHARRRRGAMARGAARDEPRAQERTREEGPAGRRSREGQCDGACRRTKACAAYASVRAAAKRRVRLESEMWRRAARAHATGNQQRTATAPF